MTNIRIRKTDSPNVRNAKTVAKAMIAYAKRYVEQTGASQLVVTDAEKYDAPAVIADAERNGKVTAIWIVFQGGTQLIRPAGTDLGKTCRQTLETFRGSRIELWRVEGSELRLLAHVPPSATREQVEAFGLALDYQIQADGYEIEAARHAIEAQRYEDGRLAHDDTDGYWTTRRDEHANGSVQCAERAATCRDESAETLLAAVG